MLKSATGTIDKKPVVMNQPAASKSAYEKTCLRPLPRKLTPRNFNVSVQKIFL